jgi:hypothetical protein
MKNIVQLQELVLKRRRGKNPKMCEEKMSCVLGEKKLNTKVIYQENSFVKTYYSYSYYLKQRGGGAGIETVKVSPFLFSRQNGPSHLSSDIYCCSPT